MIKALFFDIDGTLVSFKTHQIPVSTIEALEAAKAKGIQIFISTGRPRVIINNLAALQERKLIDGYITITAPIVLWTIPSSTKAPFRQPKWMRWQVSATNAISPAYW